MDNVTKEKIEQIITSLETEQVNIASKIDLQKNPTDNYSRTKDLMNIGSVILWLKNCLRQELSKDSLIDKIKLFEEVVKDSRYISAGNISEIAYLTNKVTSEVLEEKEIKEIIQRLIILDENNFYPINELKKAKKEEINNIAKQISNEAAKDAARIIKTLLKDDDYIQKIKDSGYRIDEDFIKPEHHKTSSLQEQITNSLDISNRLNHIIKQIKPSKER